MQVRLGVLQEAEAEQDNLRRREKPLVYEVSIFAYNHRPVILLLILSGAVTKLCGPCPTV